MSLQSDDLINAQDRHSSSDSDDGDLQPVRQRRNRSPDRPVPPPGWSYAMPNPNIHAYCEEEGPKVNIPFDDPEVNYLMTCIGQNFFWYYC